MGSTDDLSSRIWAHKNELTPSFTSRHGIKTLVYYERYDRLMDARAREYAVKEMASGVENSDDRSDESGMGRSLSRLEYVNGAAQLFRWIADKVPLALRLSAKVGVVEMEVGA